MSKEAVIRLKNVNKTFFIDEGIAMSIRDFSKSIFGVKRTGKRKMIKAVEDVNLEIEKGEFFGIVGRNGSGKSTLLNMMIGAIRPDKGSIIETKGKIVRLALGMGFDPNLTARDNIYVNASILGLTFKRIGLIFDDIIGFAELEKFVDFPVKNFSSGMISKLKFSIAIHAKADIFLMDEFFGGVGDESFKKKSAEVFKNTFLDGRTIVHVSHQLGTIQQHCKRVLLLDRGKSLMVDHPDVVIPAYKKLFIKDKEKLALKEEKDKERESKIIVKESPKVELTTNDERIESPKDSIQSTPGKTTALKADPVKSITRKTAPISDQNNVENLTKTSSPKTLKEVVDNEPKLEDLKALDAKSQPKNTKKN